MKEKTNTVASTVLTDGQAEGHTDDRKAVRMCWPVYAANTNSKVNLLRHQC